MTAPLLHKADDRPNLTAIILYALLGFAAISGACANAHENRPALAVVMMIVGSILIFIAGMWFGMRRAVRKTEQEG